MRRARHGRLIHELLKHEIDDPLAVFCGERATQLCDDRRGVTETINQSHHRRTYMLQRSRHELRIHQDALFQEDPAHRHLTPTKPTTSITLPVEECLQILGKEHELVGIGLFDGSGHRRHANQRCQQLCSQQQSPQSAVSTHEDRRHLTHAWTYLYMGRRHCLANAR